MPAGSIAAPNSACTGIAWPALLAQGEAQLLALQYQLEQSQWWAPALLRRQQFQQLQNLIDHAYREIPFYSEWLRAANYQAGQETTEAFWSRLPILTRRDVQAHGEELTCAEIPGDHGQILKSRTTGSTGTPLKHARTHVDQLIWHALTLREALWHRRDFGLKLAVIRRDPDEQSHPPSGRQLTDWGHPIAAAFPTGPAVMLDNRSSTEEQANWLLREDPDYLIALPSIVGELARWFLERGKRLERLKDISTIGEALAPRLREICREAFGVRIADIYSATETGYLALQCPESLCYHVQSEAVLLEVLDERGRPCEPGEIGAVVATPLHNFAMPLIRYAIGDLAEVGGPCACGRGLPVLRQILGRARDTVMTPAGTRRYAWIGMRHLNEIPEVVQFQVVQRSLHDLEVKLVTRATLDREKEERIRTRLKQSLGEHFSVVLTYHHQIPRAPSGKYFDFICEVAG